nr:hypothetical protein CFP56_13888 [Quercus suber]
MMGPQQSLKRKSNQTPPLLESITQSESFSGSKGDDGTATELEEKIKSDTATVGTPVRLGYYWIIIELRFMIIIFHKDSAQ